MGWREWNLETVNEFSFCRFYGLFQEILSPFVGGYIAFVYYPQQTDSKFAKNSQKSDET